MQDVAFFKLSSLKLGHCAGCRSKQEVGFPLVGGVEGNGGFAVDIMILCYIV